MARDLTASFVTELTADPCRPRYFFEGVFGGTPLRLWTGKQDITWNSVSWLGNGQLKDVGDITESGDLTPHELEIQLTGEPSALISIALSSAALNDSGKLYLGFLNSSSAVIADPYLIFSGLLDNVELEDDPDEATLHLRYESRLIQLDHALNYKYNHETQQVFYSGDMGFEYHEQMENWSGYWGKPQKDKRPKKDKGDQENRSASKPKRGRKKKRRKKR